MGIEIIAVCDGCNKCVSQENAHISGNWMTKGRFIEEIGKIGWKIVGEKVLCNECCDV